MRATGHVCEDCGAPAGRLGHEDAPALCGACFARRYPVVTPADLADGTPDVAQDWSGVEEHGQHDVRSHGCDACGQEREPGEHLCGDCLAVMT